MHRPWEKPVELLGPGGRQGGLVLGCGFVLYSCGLGLGCGLVLYSCGLVLSCGWVLGRQGGLVLRYGLVLSCGLVLSRQGGLILVGADPTDRCPALLTGGSLLSLSAEPLPSRPERFLPSLLGYNVLTCSVTDALATKYLFYTSMWYSVTLPTLQLDYLYILY